ncbi:transcriptional regulator [Cupriavidus sp. TA19]|uniref:MocR-like pyridoxine biosynthesis transcription factor PdxR n=1 Tax=unclassified Cupriavidus TaxID=2640874 RepID=UPI000E2F84E4|nr:MULTISPECIES: PLP-dependent aminotransferase family protein [unclassified Cupriavidus]BDB24529.1 PLP-dependent aminotransferase family protein [Cupriavidus sp. P-10]GLC96570.1 transcriptional regulator [Cupriavidus sp. TA19]
MRTLALKLDRASRTSLAEQIRLGITGAIEKGVLVPGARLPSWVDLAAQLGVARGTVKTAYDRLTDAQLVVSSRAGGTRVSEHAAVASPITERARSIESDLRSELYQHFLPGPAVFQMGVPASDCFPATLFSRLRARAARDEVEAPAAYPDPRGEHELRREIAAHLALARGIECQPSQVFITAGCSGALGVALRVIQAEGLKAWVENPGFLPSRRALEISRLTTVPIPVDEDGMDVGYGEVLAPDAAVALVTAGQQAPLGPTLSLARRVQILEWATRTGAWIIEDDYLGELQLTRRAAPALASLDRAGRVIHIGSFSKTISPTLRLGFAVVPPGLLARFDEAVACLASAPGPAVQMATAEFMRDGHYIRHLRRMKRIYAGRSQALLAAVRSRGFHAYAAGLAVVARLPDGADDKRIAREAYAYGLAPAPLSGWYCSAATQRSGLLLGVATAIEHQLPAACDRLQHLVRKFS